MSELTTVLIAVIAAVPTTLAALAALRVTKRVEGTLANTAISVAETAARGRAQRLEAERRARLMAETMDHILEEVRTLNGKTLGELADAIETRRISKISPKERTGAEGQHLDVIPMEDI